MVFPHSSGCFLSMRMEAWLVNTKTWNVWLSARLTTAAPPRFTENQHRRDLCPGSKETMILLFKTQFIQFIEFKNGFVGHECSNAGANRKERWLNHPLVIHFL